MKKIVLVFLILLLVGCSSENVYEIMKQNEHIILDVRTKEEYDSLHIKNSINIPLDLIDESIDLDKDKIIFVYCKSGNRSKVAYNKLKELGYTVYDLGALADIDLEKES